MGNAVEKNKVHTSHNLRICLIQSRMFDKQLSVYSFAVKLPIHDDGTTFSGRAPYRIPELTWFAGVCSSKFECRKLSSYLKTLNAN